MAGKKKLSIEESMARLDAISTEMEKPGVSLENSFKLFNEGLELVKKVRGDLTDVEKKIKILQENEVSKEEADE